MEQSDMKKNATIYDLLKQDHKDVKKLFKQILDEERYQDNIYRDKECLISSYCWRRKSFLS